MGEETGHVLRGLWQPEGCSTGGQNIHKTKESHLGVPLQSPAWFLKKKTKTKQVPRSYPQLAESNSAE